MCTGDDFLTTFKTRAVVLKTQDLKENDKILWLYTEKLGKISSIIKGVKKSNSRFLPLTLPFCFGEYVIFKGKNSYSINDGMVIDSFQEFLNELETLTYASYLNELIDISMISEESNRMVFKDLVTAFYLIKNSVGDVETLARAFELKLLKNTGYEIDFDNCAKCKKTIGTSNYISFQYFGGICNECIKDGGKIVSRPAYNTLKFLSKLPLEKVYRLNLSLELKKEVFEVLNIFISQNYARTPNSLQFLNSLKEELK